MNYKNLFTFFAVIALMLTGCAHKHDDLEYKIIALEAKLSKLDSSQERLENTLQGKTSEEIARMRDEAKEKLAQIQNDKNRASERYNEIVATQSTVNHRHQEIEATVSTAKNMVNSLLNDPTVIRLTTRLEFFEQRFATMLAQTQHASDSASFAADSANDAADSAYNAAEDAKFALFVKGKLKHLADDIDNLRHQVRDLKSDNKSDVNKLEKQLDRLNQRLDNIGSLQNNRQQGSSEESARSDEHNAGGNNKPRQRRD